MLQVKILDHAKDFRTVEEVDGEQVLFDVLPVFDHEGDLGRRLYVLEDIVLKPFQPTKIPHGIAVQPSEGHGTFILPRSSALPKQHSHIVVGTIDRGYDGELISSVMYCPPAEEFEITEGGCEDGCCGGRTRSFMAFPTTPLLLKKGQRVSQLVEIAAVSAPYKHAKHLEVVADFGPTARGAGAFGSTDS